MTTTQLTAGTAQRPTFVVSQDLPGRPDPAGCLYLDFRSLNRLDSLVGLIVVHTAFALPVTIPVMAFFLLLQRRLTTGLVAGAVKG
jgi:ABC-type glycerol-3-phosphate transport system permease component